MGINAEWARIWKGEGAEYVRDSVQVDTVFLDGQIMLMQSQVAREGMTWDEFVRRNFSSRLDARARSHRRVIIAFDNYEEVRAPAPARPARSSHARTPLGGLTVTVKRIPA